MKRIINSILRVLLTSVTFTFVSCSILSFFDNDDSSSTEEVTLSRPLVLTSLGVDTSLGLRVDPKENSLSEDYNPFGGSTGILFKQCEIYAAGIGVGNYYNALFEDGTNNYAELYKQPDTSGWATVYPKKSIAADVDGDGLDEIVIVVYYTNDSNKVSLRIVDYNEDGSIVTAKIVREFTFTGSNSLNSILSGTAGGSNLWEDAFFRQDIARGDIDGDGMDEIILAIGLNIYVLDDYNHDFATIETGIELEDLDNGSDSYVRIDTADFDMDGKDELVITNGEDNGSIMSKYYIYDDDMNTILNSGYIASTIDGNTYKMRAAAVTTGDYDNDGLPEIAFSGKREDNNDLLTLILDTEMDETSSPIFSFLETYTTDNNENNYLIPAMDSGDIDGDGDDEIAVFQDILALTNGKLTYPFENEALVDSSNTDKFPAADILSIGDVTGDKKADVVYITEDNEQIRIRYVKENGDLGLKIIYIDPDPSRPTLCLPNVDNDSAILKYKEHELLFTDPIIVATVASPPYWEGINEDGEGSTGFGSIEGHSSETSESQGFSVGFSVGCEFESPFGSSGISVKASVEKSFTWGVATTHEVTETWGYNTGVGEDKVIFTSIPFDVYYYEVLSSPLEDQIGQTITINVPRSPGKYHVERTFYNSNNGTGFDIGNSILVHTPGDPLSYSNESDRDELKANSDGGLFSNHNVEVGTSNTGTSIITLEELESSSSSYEKGFSVSVETEVKAAYLTAGVSAGYNNSYSYTTTVTSGTYIEGKVPDIPANKYTTDIKFHWGLMAYPKESNDQKFTVVTYWVDQ